MPARAWAVVGLVVFRVDAAAGAAVAVSSWWGTVGRTVVRCGAADFRDGFG